MQMTGRSRIRFPTQLVFRFVSGVAVIFVCNSAFAQTSIVTFSASSPGLIVGSDFLSQVVVVDDTEVEVKVRGYTVELDGNESRIYGPYPTGNHLFGVTASGFSNRPGFGLISRPLPGIDTTGIDFGGNASAPGFDNGPYLGDNPNVPGPPLPKIEFALFSFSSPIRVSQVIVDDVVNHNRHIWAAGGTSSPDLSAGLIPAFSGYSIQRSVDDASDGQFTHNFDQFQQVSFLAVGVPISSRTVGSFGSFPTHNGTDQLYIVGLGISPVPEPETYAMLLAGMGLIGFKARRRKTS